MADHGWCPTAIYTTAIDKKNLLILIFTNTYKPNETDLAVQINNI